MNAHQVWVAFLTIVTKEIRRFTRIWVQTLLPPAIMMALYFVIFGNLIGPRIGDMDGFDYMDFIVPGLIMMSVITNSYANVVSSFFSMKFQHSIEEILVSPVPNWVVLSGYVMGGVGRGISVGLIVTLLSLGFTDLRVENIAVTASIVILTAILFSIGGFINAIYATKFDDISIVPTFILTPLTYLGGVFYSISLLPEFWQGVSQINPILYMVNAFRYGILGVSDVDIGISYLMICGFIVIGFSYALYLLNRGKGIRA
ncbi:MULTISPECIES: ABC transporter permease [unclassified Oleiphilus]|jgi:ABC-2 type transport system permease protein|uniref:ABC transporter permease n=2 Tax=Oleiphilus TaxID=141450 RepID=UPI0007C3D0F2|nr:MULTISPECIES: ABC transporter permease [unclassified Oleiphilus]KZY47391.1 ABC transporter permease [Oleiphilus sp. HI0050]KZY74227.1 ABC transporter permease [Oleiphilus sp. HI0068]KZY85050.1 ABC transporter permease [Oleiphilus sp. HI0069]KZY86016.1 ABC transporter permease [Oleiphilus sp. HI0072]KZZ19887.1 ABC transporter permease [Oleiphilus sp. HI0078]KZZ21515.1 ABC transporter permease [Oleiphilus sp. HI0081]KZZ47586.1 ABC transporter permease [Oleiphilus sp. HI0085]